MHPNQNIRIVSVRFPRTRTTTLNEMELRGRYTGTKLHTADLPIDFKQSDLSSQEYPYKTFDKDIVVGDVVVVEARNFYKLVVVTEIREHNPLSDDPELNFIAEAAELRYVIARIDTAAHKKVLRREAEQKRAIKLLEEASKRISVQDQFERVKGTLSPAELAFVAGALGFDDALPAPASIEPKPEFDPD